MIHLTIDGIQVEAPDNSTVLEAARLAGVEIPTLCDHPALKPFGGCRMCVVEIEGWRTLQASCTMPANEGMVVKTDTPKLRAAREFILSLLFSERNHFCMYCQKTDGDCELQNSAYAEEMTHWPMQPNWNPFPVDTSHPYYVLDNNRCILCRRCVRACGDLVGNFTLGVEARGPHTIIVADTNVALGDSTCIKCGTCVQVCPTGALIDKTSAYLGKDHLATRVKTVCTGCDVGCGVEALVLDNLLLHLDGDAEAPVNAGVLCELGRYKLLGRDKDRVTKPMVRKEGKLVETTWEEALSAVVTGIGSLAGKHDGLAALASARLSAEALHAFKSLFAGKLGAEVATLKQEAAGFDGAYGSLEDLKSADCVVVVGADLVKDHQVAGFFIKRNIPYGTRLIAVSSGESRLPEIASYTLSVEPGKESEMLYGLAAGIRSLGLARQELEGADLNGVTPEKAAKACGVSAETLVGAARELGEARKPVLVVDASASEAMKAAKELAKWLGAPQVISLLGSSNSAAAHAYGLDKPFKLNGHKAAYLALGDEEPNERALALLEKGLFTVVQASWASAATERADVVLPVETWLEQEGHYLSLEGRLQKSSRAVESAEGVCSNIETIQRVSAALGVGISEPADAWKVELGANLPA